jgi:hypothetical protein
VDRYRATVVLWKKQYIAVDKYCRKEYQSYAFDHFRVWLKATTGSGCRLALTELTRQGLVSSKLREFLIEAMAYRFCSSFTGGGTGYTFSCGKDDTLSRFMQNGGLVVGDLLKACTEVGLLDRYKRVDPSEADGYCTKWHVQLSSKKCDRPLRRLKFMTRRMSWMTCQM